MKALRHELERSGHSEAERQDLLGRAFRQLSVSQKQGGQVLLGTNAGMDPELRDAFVVALRFEASWARQF